MQAIPFGLSALLGKIWTRLSLATFRPLFSPVAMMSSRNCRSSVLPVSRANFRIMTSSRRPLLEDPRGQEHLKRSFLACVSHPWALHGTGRTRTPSHGGWTTSGQRKVTQSTSDKCPGDKWYTHTCHTCQSILNRVTKSDLRFITCNAFSQTWQEMARGDGNLVGSSNTIKHQMLNLVKLSPSTVCTIHQRLPSPKGIMLLYQYPFLPAPTSSSSETALLA